MTQNSKRIYEGMFLVDSAVAGDQWDQTLAAISTILDRAGAETINIRKWDERRLSYDVAKCKRGTYILSYFRAMPDSIGRMERDVRLNELILRVLILRVDHLSAEDMEAPTPALRATQAKEKAEAVAADEAAPTTDEAAPSEEAKEDTVVADAAVAPDEQDASEVPTVKQADFGEPQAPEQTSEEPTGQDHN